MAQVFGSVSAPDAFVFSAIVLNAFPLFPLSSSTREGLGYLILGANHHNSRIVSWIAPRPSALFLILPLSLCEKAQLKTRDCYAIPGDYSFAHDWAIIHL